VLDTPDPVLSTPGLTPRHSRAGTAPRERAQDPEAGAPHQVAPCVLTLHIVCPTLHTVCPTRHIVCITLLTLCSTLHIVCPTRHIVCITPHAVCIILLTVCLTLHIVCPTLCIVCLTHHTVCLNTVRSQAKLRASVLKIQKLALRIKSPVAAQLSAKVSIEWSL